MEGLSAEEKVCSLFQPDILLPAEFFDALRRKRRLEPEYRLMLAVLEDAFSCFRKYLLARDEKGKKLFHEVEDWLLEEDTDWIFSFENVCGALGFNPAYIRQGLLRWQKREMTRSRKSDVLSPQERRVANESRGRVRLGSGVGDLRCMQR